MSLTMPWAILGCGGLAAFVVLAIFAPTVLLVSAFAAFLFWLIFVG